MPTDDPHEGLFDDNAFGIVAWNTRGASTHDCQLVRNTYHTGMVERLPVRYHHTYAIPTYLAAAVLVGRPR